MSGCRWTRIYASFSPTCDAPSLVRRLQAWCHVDIWQRDANSSFPSYPTLLSHMLYTLPVYEDEQSQCQPHYNLCVVKITAFQITSPAPRLSLNNKWHQAWRYGRLHIRHRSFKATKWADFGVVGLRSMGFDDRGVFNATSSRRREGGTSEDRSIRT